MLDEVLQSWGFPEVEPMDMYSDIFNLGSGFIQKCGEPKGQYKTNPIITGSKNGLTRQYIMFEDQFEQILEKFQSYDWAFLNGITYWGRHNKSASQSKMCAMIFDLDGVDDKCLFTLLDGMHEDVYPMPNYIVLSGHGVHLYFVFEEPLSLYPNTKTELKSLKYALTTLLWNERTSKDSNVQYQGINQSYRIVGGKTKIEGVRARAFRVSEHPISVDYLNEFVPEKDRVDTSRIYKESLYSIAEARELFPDWYERRVLNKEPRGTWVTDRHVYDWWKTKIFSNAAFGHRYFCVMALAIYAIKCNIPEDELIRDAYSFMSMLNAIHPEDPFLESDVESALECYDLRYKTFPREDISKLTGIQILPNKRNKQDRWTHLQADEWIIDGEPVENKCKRNRELGLEKARREGRITGRPKGSGTKQAEVLDYYQKHPGTTVEQAANALKMSTGTIQKWKPVFARRRKRAGAQKAT